MLHPLSRGTAMRTEEEMGRRCWCYAKLVLLIQRLRVSEGRRAVLKLRWHLWADKRWPRSV